MRICGGSIFPFPRAAGSAGIFFLSVWHEFVQPLVDDPVEEPIFKATFFVGFVGCKGVHHEVEEMWPNGCAPYGYIGANHVPMQ